MDATKDAANPKPTVPAQVSTTIDIAGIMHAIPHRYPMLLIDKMIDVVPNESATGIKNVTVNEHFFQGHFPQHPIMPGVLIIESMASSSISCQWTARSSAAPLGQVTSFASMSPRIAAAAMSGASRLLPRSMASPWPRRLIPP